MVTYTANARMYAVHPAVAEAWAALFGWLARRSGVNLTVIDHSYPAPLPDLWARPDLACGFICGFPFTQTHRTMQPVAAPVPDRGPGTGLPRYATHLVVRTDSPFQTIEQTFGGLIGYTVDDSYSGSIAMRHFLAPFQEEGRSHLYAAAVGPLVTPRRVIEALIAGQIDVGPLDSYALDLMLAYEPGLADQIRIIATTRAAPMPFLAAHPDCPGEIVDRLRSTLVFSGPDDERDRLLSALLLRGFAPVSIADYAEIKPATGAPLASAWQDSGR